MSGIDSRKWGYAVAAALGALVGGILVLWLTKAIPKMMSRMMNEMMSSMPQAMMAQMEKEGLNPAEMCQQMMAQFRDTQQPRER
ncbi:MAG: hypothetical protein PVH17_13060 [Anaerolineae bacterium]|jgi:hypothetical protein